MVRMISDGDRGTSDESLSEREIYARGERENKMKKPVHATELKINVIGSCHGFFIRLPVRGSRGT